MSFDESVIQSVGVLVGMILLGMFLRERGAIREAHGEVFASLITRYTLPALIFVALSSTVFTLDKLQMAGVMISSQLVCGLIAWVVGRGLHLSRPRLGALILASMFASSGFLGYAVVRQVYGDDPEALADAAVVSELGVAMMIFTLGVAIAIHFGRSASGSSERHRGEVVRFFYSPIFIALLLGIGCSFLPIPREQWAVQGVYKLLGTIASANTVLVTLTIGVMLHVRDLRKALPVVVLACALKLVVQPMVAWGQAEWLGFDPVWREIVTMEAAMPTAALTAIFAKRYGCDSELTTILIFATFLSSIGSIVAILFLLG